MTMALSITGERSAGRPTRRRRARRPRRAAFAEIVPDPRQRHDPAIARAQVHHAVDTAAAEYEL